MFELGIISDEISDDFERACSLVRAWGMERVELRTLWEKNVLELDPDEVAAAKSIVERHGLTVTALCTPVFKSPLSGVPADVTADFALAGMERFEDQLALLRRSCGLAKVFGTELVRVFTFFKEPWDAGLVTAIALKLAAAAELARAAGTRLVIENEPACAVGSGRQLGELDATLLAQAPDLADVIALLWDPGNAVTAGEADAFPGGYRALDPARIAHVHLKDVEHDAHGFRFVPVGQGAIDYRGQLRALIADGYRGVLVLEPHYRPEGLSREDAAKAAVDAARTLLDSVPYA
jgi:L-ribulose-5-phosphate 3-epimerase